MKIFHQLQRREQNGISIVQKPTVRRFEAIPNLSVIYRPVLGPHLAHRMVPSLHHRELSRAYFGLITGGNVGKAKVWSGFPTI